MNKIFILREDGLFTCYLLKGLDVAAVRHGRVTVSRLYGYVERKANLECRTRVPELEPRLSRAVGNVSLR